MTGYTFEGLNYIHIRVEIMHIQFSSIQFNNTLIIPRGNSIMTGSQQQQKAKNISAPTDKKCCKSYLVTAWTMQTIINLMTLQVLHHREVYTNKETLLNIGRGLQVWKLLLRTAI